MITISATDARNNLYDLIEEVARSGKRIGITNKGETKVVLISPEELDAWQATAETLADKELMKAIRESDRDIKAGRYSSLEEVEKELGLSDNDKDVSSKFAEQGKKRLKKA
ncbi:hypothetical protein A2617_00015 [Candidatus Daviesbacteria bacterium RIFOXYD1_FULL_41_10]|uniref:Antitoxin n=2 Tax=Candidatus Daviesiibacteriota TaxID=1752718 RepID=A0A1F5N207_9BACT|nr:MAG: Prevent-host-death protein [Candidatus Daviesbacteria bacterium GW2011_GWB1_41_5]OGE71602.1 MAG: hypothetical protein A2617_00015 [Candidatus Daviesbacteria bacterium RIFOXYD1_FULL_41_10]